MKSQIEYELKLNGTKIFAQIMQEYIGKVENYLYSKGAESQISAGPISN